MTADDTVTAKLAEWEALVPAERWALVGSVIRSAPVGPGFGAQVGFAATAPTIAAALLGFVREVQGLAEWHETKAEKARAFPGAGHENAMEKAAQVHDDAARRLRQAARKWIGGA
jgi:hypothetical protein